MKKLIKRLQLDTKMGSDIFWNMVSMVFVAASGLIYSSVFIMIFEPAIWGTFSLANVYYIIFSQLAVFGIHFSVLKHSSNYADDEENRNKLITTALLATFLISVVVCGVSLLISILLSRLVESDVLEMLYFAFPAIVFFALNKVLLNYLNGIRCMKFFALFQSLRYIFIIFVLLILGFIKVETRFLMLVYLISEALLFSMMFIYIKYKGLIKFKFDINWFKEHYSFGSKIFLGNLVIDLNSKMDVWILGWFVSPYIVGVYSFAVIFAEGFYQILAVIRKNINPLIAQMHDKKPEDFKSLRKSVFKKAYKFSPFLGIAVVGGFYILCLILGRMDYIGGIMPLSIVILSNVICSYFIIMGNTMNQTGNPKYETLLNVITIVTNCVLNILFIPMFGMIGAAVATAISYFVYSVALNIIVKKQLDVNLLKI